MAAFSDCTRLKTLCEYTSFSRAFKQPSPKLQSGSIIPQCIYSRMLKMHCRKHSKAPRPSSEQKRAFESQVRSVFWSTALSLACSSAFQHSTLPKHHSKSSFVRSSCRLTQAAASGPLAGAFSAGSGTRKSVSMCTAMDGESTACCFPGSS